jgi:hypothetical protein
MFSHSQGQESLIGCSKSSDYKIVFQIGSESDFQGVVDDESENGDDLERQLPGSS